MPAASRAAAKPGTPAARKGAPSKQAKPAARKQAKPAAGKPVLTEKPLCTTVEDCRKAGCDARMIGRLTARGAVTLRVR